MQASRIPKLLQEIPDTPQQLFLLGNLPAEEEHIFLTVIGSRKYSSYGKSVVENIIAGLKGYPFVIVSGLALGIDGIAHRSALTHGLPTIAIPGSGLDASVLYPASHRNLAKEIIHAGGALLSEFTPTQKAQPWTFPKRNRIMAGISHATIVIEAENTSGTRITARLATEYNRDVFAVPGSIFSSVSEGTNALLREGAIPLTKAEDILLHFGFDTDQAPRQETLTLSPEEEKILSLLDTPQSKDALARALEIPIFALSTHISSLEIKGLVEERLGKVQKIH